MSTWPRCVHPANVHPAPRVRLRASGNGGSRSSPSSAGERGSAAISRPAGSGGALGSSASALSGGSSTR
eukprot:4763857-Prymnesium_polylepis.1